MRVRRARFHGSVRDLGDGELHVDRIRLRHLRGDPGGDGRAVSRRRIQRPQRAEPVRDRAQPHPAATSAGTVTATSQLALPEDACRLVYATDGYGQSVRNLAQTSLASDNVFGDGSDQQLAKVTGNVSTGFTAALSVPV
jgi:hypothetical protein